MDLGSGFRLVYSESGTLERVPDFTNGWAFTNGLAILVDFGPISEARGL